MKYCFIISNARLDYFRIEKIMKELENPPEFILIFSNRTSHNIPDSFCNKMKEVFRVDLQDFETCKGIIDKFITKDCTASIVCTDEVLLQTAAELRQYYYLQGPLPYEYIPFNNKTTMKHILNAGGVRTPRFIDLDFKSAYNNLKEYHRFISGLLQSPYIIKPVNSGACEGIGKIREENDLIDWYTTVYQQDLEYTAEEFIEGIAYHCDSFVVNKEILFQGVCQYMVPCLDFLSGKNIGSYLIDKNTLLYRKIIEFNERVIELMQPPDGATHLEFFINFDEELIFLEIGARPPGKKACLCYEKSYGMNLYELTLRRALGLMLPNEIEMNRPSGCITFSSSPGTITQLNLPLLKSKTEWDWRIQVSHEILAYPSCINEGIAAELFIYNDCYKELMDDIAILKDYKVYLCS